MQPDELKYANLTPLIAPLAVKGKTESVTFLNWFLENIYRLGSRPINLLEALMPA
jgi:hypothetical protein